MEERQIFVWGFLFELWARNHRLAKQMSTKYIGLPMNIYTDGQTGIKAVNTYYVKQCKCQETKMTQSSLTVQFVSIYVSYIQVSYQGQLHLSLANDEILFFKLRSNIKTKLFWRRKLLQMEEKEEKARRQRSQILQKWPITKLLLFLFSCGHWAMLSSELS